VFQPLPLRMRALSHMATVVKDQHVPQVPWALTGETTPLALQSREVGGPSSFKLALSDANRNLLFFLASYSICSGSLSVSISTSKNTYDPFIPECWL